MEGAVITERLRRFLIQQFPMTKNVGDDEPLLKNGLIDSLGILEVMTFVEKEFGIVVSDEDLLPENFGSIRSLTNFVHGKAETTSL